MDPRGIQVGMKSIRGGIGSPHGTVNPPHPLESHVSACWAPGLGAVLGVHSEFHGEDCHFACGVEILWCAFVPGPAVEAVGAKKAQKNGF